MLKRFVATTLATAAFAAAMTAVAAPASASPEDGEGCVGFPSVAETYVCVIAVTPQNALPTTTTTVVPVTVPRFCYVADCTGPTTVNVPVPGVQPGSGLVATLWYRGEYIPVAIGQVPPVPNPLTLDPAELADTVMWLPFETLWGSREAWIEYRDNAYATICTETNGLVCLP